MGCHDTRAEAEAQERAVQAQKSMDAPTMPDFYRLEGREIFRAGTWQGENMPAPETFTEADLDQIVASAARVGFRPPLKAGHVPDTPGRPALGWVENLRRIGQSLVADLVALPKSVFDAITNRRYDTVSIELIPTFERNGETLRNVLKAVALLGADIPAVDLKPLHEAFDQGNAEVRVFRMPRPDEGAMTMADPKTAEAQAAEIAALKAQLAEAHAKAQAAEAKAAEAKSFSAEVETLKTRLADAEQRQAAAEAKALDAEIRTKTEACVLPALRPYVEALYTATMKNAKVVKFSAEGKAEAATDTAPVAVLDALVAALNAPTRAKLFAVQSTVGDPAPALPQGASKAEIDAQVDTLVRQYRAAHPTVSYTAALDAVLQDPAHDALKRAYAAAR